MAQTRTSLLEEFLYDPNKTIVLDGALATGLEERGADISGPLWSCETLIQQPDLIKDVHLSHFRAGADVATTASYQASTDGLEKHHGGTVEQAKQVVRDSVDLAFKAGYDHEWELVKDDPEAKPVRNFLVAGSVGPYGAFLADGSEYRGDYRIHDDWIKIFHRPRIEALLEAGVDLLAIETIPSFQEAKVLLRLLVLEVPSVKAWISFTLRDGETISDGTPLERVAGLADACSQIVAVGVNCVPPELVTPAMKALRKGTKKPLVCYPNSGETWDAESRSWSGKRVGDGLEWNGPGKYWAATTTDGQKWDLNWIELVREWEALGARMIGGCCRTGPTDISQIAASIQDRRQNAWDS